MHRESFVYSVYQLPGVCSKPKLWELVAKKVCLKRVVHNLHGFACLGRITKAEL